MIFRPELVKLIRQQRKTQTRRLIKRHPTYGFVIPCRYKPGHAYSVQRGRCQPGDFRITITEVRQEALGALSLPDAKREGFKTTMEFFEYWEGLYGAVDREQLVWVVSFVLGEQTDSDEYLTPAARPHGSEHGYTPNPQDALEVVSVVSRGEVDRMAAQAAKLRGVSGEVVQQRIRSASIRLKDAGRRGDMRAVATITRELNELLREAA